MPLKVSPRIATIYVLPSPEPSLSAWHFFFLHCDLPLPLTHSLLPYLLTFCTARILASLGERWPAHFRYTNHPCRLQPPARPLHQLLQAPWIPLSIVHIAQSQGGVPECLTLIDQSQNTWSNTDNEGTERVGKEKMFARAAKARAAEQEGTAF